MVDLLPVRKIFFLGAYELFNITDKLSIHKNIDFPGHKHASLYDVNRIEKEIRDLLLSFNIDIKLQSRAVDVVKEEDLIKAVVLSNGEKNIWGCFYRYYGLHRAYGGELFKVWQWLCYVHT